MKLIIVWKTVQKRAIISGDEYSIESRINGQSA